MQSVKVPPLSIIGGLISLWSLNRGCSCHSPKAIRMPVPVVGAIILGYTVTVRGIRPLNNLEGFSKMKEPFDLLIPIYDMFP